MTRIDLANCYRTLDLAVGAPEDEIRRAYKLLVNVWHPDRFEHDADLRRAAEEKLKSINEAFQQLRSAGFEAPATAVGPQNESSSSGASAPRKKVVRRTRVPALSSLLETSQRHIRRGRSAEAIAELTRAAALYPTAYEVWHELAWACGNEDAYLLQADSAACQAVRLGPERNETTSLLQHKNRWAPSGLAAQVQSFYEERLRVDPSNPRLWANLGYLLYSTVADKRPARDALARSAELDPDNRDVWFRLGLCLSPEEVRLRDACRASLRRLGRAGDAMMLQSLVPLGTRLRQWFRGR
ncbi:MAG: hypothetical protein DMF81_14710 [Acidobacteria bacterium]|nr:MAG: hypothetical protein DMF81_14710 [Acidobacteriota bacterium]